MEESNQSYPSIKSRPPSSTRFVMGYAIDEASGRICGFESEAELRAMLKKEKSVKSPKREAE